MKKEKDDEGGGFSGKRNKSWREIDAQRGKKSKYTSRQDDPQQQKIERSSSYTRYKQAADSLFSGGALPDGLAKTFDPEGKREAQKEARFKLSELDRKDWVDGVVKHLEQYPELPEDAYFLDSLLDHPRDRIVDKALGRLEGLVEEGKLTGNKLPKSLSQRLKSLEMTSMDSEIQARAKELRAKIGL